MIDTNTERTEDAQGLANSVQHLIRMMVKDPDNAFVNITHLNNTILFEIEVSDSDKGIIIGRGGKMILCLRHLITSIASKLKIRCYVEIKE